MAMFTDKITRLPVADVVVDETLGGVVRWRTIAGEQRLENSPKQESSEPPRLTEL